MAKCPDTPHGVDIGDDATGRRYLDCSTCGKEFLIDPGGPYDMREAEPNPHEPLIEQLRAWADTLEDRNTDAIDRAKVIKGMRETADDLERDSAPEFERDEP